MSRVGYEKFLGSFWYRLLAMEQHLQRLSDSHLFFVACAADQYPSRGPSVSPCGQTQRGEVMFACYSRADRDEDGHVSSRDLRDSRLNKHPSKSFRTS